MAKALFGAVGLGTDPRVIAEVRRLRLRVRELESELDALRAAHEELAATAVDHDLLHLSSPEPALA